MNLDYTGLLISFSLFGQNRKYLEGMCHNADLAPQAYPGAKVVVYCDNSLPTIYRMRLRGKVELISGYTEAPGMFPNFWRYMAYDKMMNSKRLNAVLFRDADSRLNERERLAVTEWLFSDYLAHTMRDHPHHKFRVMAGLLGLKRNALPEGTTMDEELSFYDATYLSEEGYQYGDDPVVMDKILKDTPIMAHDAFYANEFPHSGAFPAKRDGLQFVGEIYNQRNQPLTRDRETLAKAINE